MESWDAIKSILNWVVYPIICVLAWVFKDQYMEIKRVKEDIAELKVTQAVSTTQIQSLSDDIKGLLDALNKAEANIREDLKELRRQ